jgi:hypothetical protein
MHLLHSWPCGDVIAPTLGLGCSLGCRLPDVAELPFTDQTQSNFTASLLYGCRGHQKTESSSI